MNLDWLCNRPATYTLRKAGLRQEIEERNGANGLLDRNLNGDSRASGSGNQCFFYHENTLHSVFTLTDSAGKLAEGYQYDAYSRHHIRTGANGEEWIRKYNRQVKEARILPLELRWVHAKRKMAVINLALTMNLTCQLILSLKLPGFLLWHSRPWRC